MEQQRLRSSKQSKGFFGKLSFHRKGKLRYQKAGLDDEESLMCDDKHETNTYETVKVESNDKPEAGYVTRKRQNGREGLIKEGSTQETEIMEPRRIQRDSEDASYHSGVQLTDGNLCESEGITASVIPEKASVVTVNAIIESKNDSGAERPLEENETGFLVTFNELYKSETCLLQNEKSTITRHFDNLSVSHAKTHDVNGEICEVEIIPGAEYKSEPTPCVSTPTTSKIHGKESPRKKKKTKKSRKLNKRNKKNFEATSDEEISFHAHSSDPETIEILVIDSDTKKEKKKKRRKKAKRIVAKAGLTMWKGIRTGWKLMWNGLAMYTVPLGSLDVTTNITKFWSANSSSSRA